ncbi:MAG: PAS domain-containing protein [Blautia sp.]|nr:PAS domain-containing protein [Blautia sp.]
MNANSASATIRDNILNNMSEGIITAGPNGVIEYVNPAVCGMLGYTDDEMLGSRFATLFLESPDVESILKTIVDAYYEPAGWKSEVVRYNKDGIEKTFRIVATVIRIENVHGGTILVIEDLSELVGLRDTVKAMRQIEELNIKLEMRNKLLSETFGRFLSDDIVKQLLDTPGGLSLGGKKKRLTMMMSDLRGFTAISERMDPAHLVRMLNHYLGSMTEIIQRHNGTIIEFIGDGIMAIFGAPESSDTHAADAVAAAIEMESEMKKINEWNLEREYPMLKMGIGIVTGEVIVGNIGSKKRTKYGVVGKSVNVCGRVESYTTAGQILVSNETKEAIQSELTIESQMKVMPKGTNEELVLYQVTGIGEPYNVFMKAEHSTMVTPRIPVPVCFYKLEGKHVLGDAYYGGMVSAGQDSAVLETDAELEILDNIKFNTGGELFCKVVEKNGRRYVLHYTYIPMNYKLWYKANIVGER